MRRIVVLRRTQEPLRLDAGSIAIRTAEYPGPTYNYFIDLAVDGSGNVFVSWGGVLQRYTPDGTPSWSVVEGRLKDGALALDDSGSVYILNGNWSTTGYDAAGQRIWTADYDAGDPRSGQTLNNDLALSPAGDLILAGGSEGDIRVLSYRLP